MSISMRNASTSITYTRTSKHDDHHTPVEAIEPLLERVNVADLLIWDPWAGRGMMADVLRARGATVFETDIQQGVEFDVRSYPIPNVDLVVTNPPFSIKRTIVERFIRERYRFALLLPLSTMCDKWYRTVADQIDVIPIYGRIKFIGHASSCPFYCAWFVSKGTK